MVRPVHTACVEYEIRWGDAEEDVSVRTSGYATVEGLIEFMRDVLDDERWRPGMRVLLDHRDLDWTGVKTDELRTRVEAVVAERQRVGGAQVATVVARKLDYGVQRMTQAFLDDRLADSFREGLFYSVEDARAWLRMRPTD